MVFEEAYVGTAVVLVGGFSWGRQNYTLRFRSLQVNVLLNFYQRMGIILGTIWALMWLIRVPGNLGLGIELGAKYLWRLVLLPPIGFY